MSFTNKIVLITGAASGIGEAIAIYFAKRSAKLSLFDCNANSLDKVSENCEIVSKIKALKVVVDITRDVDLKEGVDKTIREYGKIDILINCAGIAAYGGILKPDALDDFDKVINVNLRAVVAITHFVVPSLIKSNGCIVNVSSILAKVVTPNTLAYNISKAGVTHLTKCLALELASNGIRVNCVSPGPVKTNIMKSIIGAKEEDGQKAMDNFINFSPLKHEVKATEIAELVGFLASDKAISITGEDVVIDSGCTLTTAMNTEE